MRSRLVQSGEVETKKEATAFREVRTLSRCTRTHRQRLAYVRAQVKVLLLSYMNILKIDNLVGFDKLVKLQLDNNIIEKIENLGHLKCARRMLCRAPEAHRESCSAITA